MTRRLAALTLLLATVPAAAQPPADGRPSHVPVPQAEGTDPARLFAERIQQSKVRNDLGDLLRQFQLGGGALEDFKRRLESDPALMEKARGLLNSDDPQIQELLRNAIENAVQTDPRLRRANVSPEFLERQLRNAARPPQERDGAGDPGGRPDAPPPDATPALPRPKPPGTAARPPADPAEREARQAWAQQIARWAERIDHDRLTGPLRDSPAVNNLLRDLSQSGRNALAGGMGEGLDAQLAKLQRRWETVGDRLPTDWLSDLASRIDLKAPDLSGLPLPDVKLPNVSFNAPSLPSAGSVGAAAAGGVEVLQVALVLGAVVVVGVLLLRVRGARAAAAQARRALGPWPVDPQRVASRGDLIRAFEYLSLFRIGEPARSWHHRAIAARLGAADAARQEAATRLAALYEQARYAPDGTALTEPAFADARRQLRLLVGAAGA